MGERLLCKQEVIGSIPFTSTDRTPEDQGSARKDQIPKTSRRKWRSSSDRRSLSAVLYPATSVIRPRHSGETRFCPGVRGGRAGGSRAGGAGVGMVLIDRVKRICECDRGGRAPGRRREPAHWDRPKKCLHARRRAAGEEPAGAAGRGALRAEGFGGFCGPGAMGLAPVRGGVPGRRFGLARRSLALRGRAHDGVGGSSKIKGIWWMPWH